MNRKQIEDLIKVNRQHRQPLAKIKLASQDQLLINQHPYQIVLDNHQTFDLDEFSYRYNPIYSNFDYLLGDWSYDQLRLTGFYANGRNVPNNQKIGYLEDFLMEYCNFGVSYFVLKNLDVIKSNGDFKPRKKRFSYHRFRKYRKD